MAEPINESQTENEDNLGETLLKQVDIIAKTFADDPQAAVNAILTQSLRVKHPETGEVLDPQLQEFEPPSSEDVALAAARINPDLLTDPNELEAAEKAVDGIRLYLRANIIPDGFGSESDKRRTWRTEIMRRLGTHDENLETLFNETLHNNKLSVNKLQVLTFAFFLISGYLKDEYRTQVEAIQEKFETDAQVNEYGDPEEESYASTEPMVRAVEQSCRGVLKLLTVPDA